MLCLEAVPLSADSVVVQPLLGQLDHSRLVGFHFLAVVLQLPAALVFRCRLLCARLGAFGPGVLGSFCLFLLRRLFRLRGLVSVTEVKVFVLLGGSVPPALVKRAFFCDGRRFLHAFVHAVVLSAAGSPAKSKDL